LNNDSIKCWGYNEFGQCDVPDSIQGKVVSVSCGDYFTYALLNNMTVKCWGSNGNKDCIPPDSIQGKIMNIVQ
jgi:alpha-tubulin suppressor-like RCC1 family protein